MSTRRPRPVTAELGAAAGRAVAGGAAAAFGTAEGAWRACKRARKAGESARGGEGGPIAKESLSEGGKEWIKKGYIDPPIELHTVT